MLEVKNLKKTYHTKKGSCHTALNGVSLRFEDKGMVFILGKSGSGKSTFLNVVSGLDSFDSGEILICGKSTADFSQRDYDAYRNTYMGFIFQEYNILNEFTVKENIALALELQDRSVSDKDIEQMLTVVGLEGLGERKPNELSGGQKQRVAIARALIKDPEIIFADEPTGNLDTASGVQVFETLKELSKTKLIIFVSHDRESAFKYGDRIIELSDGKVVTDLSANKNGGFSPTKKIIINKDDNCPLIGAKLPTKTAWKIALNNIGMKKGRLFFTILLIVLAISMFGFTEILAEYDMIDSSVSSFRRSDINNVVLRQGKIGEFFDYFERSYEPLQPENIELLEQAFPELIFSPFRPARGILIPLVGGAYLPTNINGVVETSEEALDLMGFPLVGEFPADDSSDVVISDFLLFTCLSRDPSLIGLNIADFVTLFSKMKFDMTIEKEKDAFEMAQLIAAETLLSGKGGNELLNSLITYILGDEKDPVDEEAYKEKKELFGIIWQKLVAAILETTNTLNFSYRFTLSGVFITGFEKYMDFLQMRTEEQIEDERAMELSHLISNYFSLFYVSKGFLTNWYENSVRMTNYILADRTMSDGGDLLNNIEVIYNNKWLQRNPNMELAEDEIIISDVLFHDIFGGLATFDNGDTPSLDTQDPNYKYLYRYTPYNDRLGVYGKEMTLKVVGIFDFYKAYRQNLDDNTENDVSVINIPRYIIAGEAIRNNAIDTMMHSGGLYVALPKGDSARAHFLRFACDGDLLMYHFTAVSNIIYTMSDMIFVFQKVFKYLSYLMGLFSVILLANFMSTSVMNKKRDIGILRALGARGKDVSKIFLNEASVIGAITTLFSCLGMALLTSIVNATLRDSFLRMFRNEAVNNLTLLTLSLTPFAIVIFMSALLVHAATIIPARKISQMRPVDAIKKA
jgi:ABC-type lipoprotein export system ATPase subunit